MVVKIDWNKYWIAILEKVSIIILPLEKGCEGELDGIRNDGEEGGDGGCLQTFDIVELPSRS